MKRVRLLPTILNYPKSMYTTFFAGNFMYVNSNWHNGALLIDVNFTTLRIVECIFDQCNKNPLYSLFFVSTLDQIGPDAVNYALIMYKITSNFDILQAHQIT